MQEIAPAAEKVPAAQSAADVAPCVWTKLPAGAGVQAAAPDVAEKVPATQSVDEIAPGPAAKLPAGAMVHAIAPVASE